MNKYIITFKWIKKNCNLKNALGFVLYKNDLCWHISRSDDYKNRKNKCLEKVCPKLKKLSKKI
jgi:hypothetical protein